MTNSMSVLSYFCPIYVLFVYVRFVLFCPICLFLPMSVFPIFCPFCPCPFLFGFEFRTKRTVTLPPYCNCVVALHASFYSAVSSVGWMFSEY